jgi:hypothetical protein
MWRRLVNMDWNANLMEDRMKSPVDLMCSLIDSVDQLHNNSVKGLDRDKLTIKRRYEHEGFGFLSVTLSALREAFDYGLSVGRFACPTSFKRRGALPAFMQGLLCKVFDIKSGLLLEAPDFESIKSVREILSVFKKTVISAKAERKLDLEAKRGFLACDQEISDVYPMARSRILDRVAGYVLSDLELSDWESIPVKHGPGAVAEGYRPNQKWPGVFKDLSDDGFLSSYFGLSDINCEVDAQDRTPVGQDLSFSQMLFESDIKNSIIPCNPRRTVAKLISVAKNSTSRRTITMEPALNMFLQQGLNTVLRESIARCPILSRCLDLTDQAKNQLMAEIGSRTGELATLDLSSASDRLASSLVYICFRRKPGFLARAYLCRSTHVLIEDDVHELRKFAGMGNALTFPVQSVVFALIAIAAMAEYDGRMPSYWSCKSYASRIRVYGDDIIVPTRYYAVVSEWLASFGLKVNQKKSFSEGNFRESCGTDWYNGVDVTPVYLRSWPSAYPADPSDLAGLVSTSNQWWLKCQYKASEFLKTYVEDFLLRKRLPLVSRSSSLLGWISRTDASDVHFWNPKLQTLMTQGYAVTPRKRQDCIDGVPAILASLISLESGGCDSLDPKIKVDYDRSVWRFHTRLRLRRMPTRLA